MLNKPSNSTNTNQPQNWLSHNKSWSRDYLYPILNAALRVKEYRFVRQTSITWLASYPGDLPIELIHGKALLGEGHIKQALRVTERLCQRDPEYLEAQRLLAHIWQIIPSPSTRAIPKNTNPQKIIKVLTGNDENNRKNAENPLREARQALLAKDLSKAEIYIQKAIASEPDSPLVALTHLRIISLRPDSPRQAVQSLAQHFHSRWPECVQFILMLADSRMDSGDSEQAVALLHQAAAYDITGQVIKRLWGQNHPYIDLWPKQLSAVISNPIPARVASELGWNLLEASNLYEIAPTSVKDGQSKIPRTPVDHPTNTADTQKPSDDHHIDHQPQKPPTSSDILPETLRSVQEELERVGERLQKPALATSDGRYPTYIVFSSRRGLLQKYGRAGFAMLDAAMQELAEMVRRKPDWGALVYYADDPTCAAQMELKPVQADDAWSLKLAIADLDQALGKKGAMIGALLIVGGPQVVPFHYLPNPTDDPDTDVPSDNPYATRDENYFIPEWPVGRLPNETGTNPSGLLGNLQSITNYHANNSAQSLRWWQQIWVWMTGWARSSNYSKSGSFGYSAEVWRKASIAVFQQIGSPKELVTSPPIEIVETVKQTDLSLRGKLGYFNLHGLADSGEWYGQRDPSNSSHGTDYPVALRTQDVINGGKAPKIIFSEACYGAHILDKNIENSLALKFLASGCRAVVGSTVMSYGSISTPLNAADLLGIAFWENLMDGIPVGDALRRAKIYLAREMHKRQGYLDGEDQKTLISFILYGDPLVQSTDQHSGLDNLMGLKRRKTFLRPISSPPAVRTVCDRAEVPGISDPIPDEVMTHIKRVVTQYLPGMQGAQVSMSHEHLDCKCDGHHCPTGQLGPKAQPDLQPERRVVTLSKSIPNEEHTHPVYARLTLDKTGKVVKLAVSR